MMRVGVIGLNHKLADISLRERLAQVCGRHFQFEIPSISYLLLSTCNRTEIYYQGREELAEAHSHILNILREALGTGFEHLLYSYFGIDCFFHLAKVTAGLDSAVIGETEIQGQVKSMYEEARSSRSLSPHLHYLFQKSLKIGKNVRSSISLCHHLPNLEIVVGEHIQRLIGEMDRSRFLLVGASEVNKKVLKRLIFLGATNLTICNRTTLHSHNFSQKWGIKTLEWERLAEWVHFDVVILGTKSPHPLIWAHQGCYQPVVLVDLSVPRNIDPELARFTDLINIDQIDTEVAKARCIHQHSFVEALRLVEQSVIAQYNSLINRRRFRCVA